jgi:hypothetical protein
MTMPDLATMIAMAPQYWLLPVGMIVIYFFARYHFNTPDYALVRASLPDSPGADEPKASPLARLRTSAPPIYTTPRDRYRKAEIMYVLGLEAAYLCLTVFPDALTALPQLQGGHEFLAQSFDNRAIIGALLLTGFLSSFPLVRDFDAWLLASLHGHASIPDDAEETADQLFEVGYRRCPTVLNDVLEGIKSPQFLAVAAGTCTGALEDRWLNVRCLAGSLKNVLQDSSRFRTFQRKFRPELLDINLCIGRTRARVAEFATLQSTVVPADGIANIDDWIDGHLSQPAVKSLKIERDKLVFEVEALFYRMCLFTSLVVYATEQNLERINAALLKIGFPVKVNVPPRNPWDAVLIAGLVTLLVTLVPTLVYTFTVLGLGIDPGELGHQVPGGPREAGVWALVTCIFHGTAALVATLRTVREIKARRANGLDLAVHDPITRNAVIAAQASVIPALVLISFALGNGTRIVDAICWIPLAFITAYFTGGYTRSFFDGRSARFLKPAVQGGCMAAASVLLSLVLVPFAPGQHLPPIFWMFMSYAGITAGLIGLTLGAVFRHQLAKNVHRLTSADEKPSRTGLSFVPQVDAATTP